MACAEFIGVAQRLFERIKILFHYFHQLHKLQELPERIPYLCTKRKSINDRGYSGKYTRTYCF